MKAKLNGTSLENGKHLDKDSYKVLHAIAHAGGELHEPVYARFWFGSSVIRCSVWIRPRKGGQWYSGHGSAGGGGYHKESAALGSAMSNAGVTLWGSPYSGGYSYSQMDTNERAHYDALDEAGRKAMLRDANRRLEKNQAHIGGCGDASMTAALEAVAKACGYRNAKVFG